MYRPPGQTQPGDRSCQFSHWTSGYDADVTRIYGTNQSDAPTEGVPPLREQCNVAPVSNR